MRYPKEAVFDAAKQEGCEPKVSNELWMHLNGLETRSQFDHGMLELNVPIDEANRLLDSVVEQLADWGYEVQAEREDTMLDAVLELIEDHAIAAEVAYHLEANSPDKQYEKAMGRLGVPAKEAHQLARNAADTLIEQNLKAAREDVREGGHLPADKDFDELEV
jgi:hypothetical protein